MAVFGLGPSLNHKENGMTEADMQAAARVADQLNEVIIFRSTGPWAKRWLERGYPSKNFHVKGKSSDWGPHAGLVPYDGTYSKVGSKTAKAINGTEANKKGLNSGFAGKCQLVLTDAELKMQLEVTAGTPLRTPIKSKHTIANSEDLFLKAERSGDQKEIVFRASKGEVWKRSNKQPKRRVRGWYMKTHRQAWFISVYPPKFGSNLRRLLYEEPEPLEVMTSGEVGAGKPMTGDYDMFAVCPLLGQYGSQSPYTIRKDAIHLRSGQTHDGIAFAPGVGMDNVPDPQFYTGGTEKTDWSAITGKLPFQKKEDDQSHRNEHPDLGNVTPRIVRCITALNIAMGAVGLKAGLRRVHHNAESHRFRLFGAITKKEMEDEGEAFPLTVFQPRWLVDKPSPVQLYKTICTLENYNELVTYAACLHSAGFFVPKSWIWRLPSTLPKAPKDLVKLLKKKL